MSCNQMNQLYCFSYNTTLFLSYQKVPKGNIAIRRRVISIDKKTLVVVSGENGEIFKIRRVT